MASPTSLGQLSYASLYLAPLTFGYLSFEENNPLIPYLPDLISNVPIQGYRPIHVFWFLTAFTFLGGMQSHGVFRAIYGPNGPDERPKHGTVQIRHSLAFVLGIDANKIPMMPCRLAHSNLTRELMKDVTQNRNRLKTGINQLKQIGSMLTLSMVPRTMYFIPMGLHRFWSRVAFLTIGAAIYLGGGSYTSLILFSSLFVLLFRKIIWAPLPDVFNTDALDDRFKPEYQIHQTDRERRSQSRIQTEESE